MAGSGGNSGPASMSGPGSLPSSAVQTKLTDEEIETLNNMKTEVLRETGDPSKGFVISFEDDAPVRPKPVLKERRLSNNKKNSSSACTRVGQLAGQTTAPTPARTSAKTCGSSDS